MNKIDRYDVNYYTYGNDFPYEFPYEISEVGDWVIFDDIEELIKRDIPMELETGLACPKCNSGNTINDGDDINNFCGNCGQRLKGVNR